MKIFKIVAFIALISTGIAQAYLVVRVDQQDFLEIAASSGGRIISEGAPNSTNRYIIYAGDGFYYLYMGPAGLQIPGATILESQAIRTEDNTFKI